MGGMSFTEIPPVVDPVVTVRGLTKSYGGRTVVDRLDLDVHPGQVVGLIGANGAGKTTTVEILQGLRRADAGAIRVLGLDPVTDADRLRPQIGGQLQKLGPARQAPGRRGRQALRGPTGHRRRPAAGAVRPGPPAKSPFAGLSGGERQRLFLVLALLNQPRLVILDELTQGLDPAARHEVWSAVARLRETGTTVLLVTHELDEAELLCEHVVAMRDGRVLDQGTPAELVARHAGDVTVRFGIVTADVTSMAESLQTLNRLPGVTGVTRDGADVVIRGTREAIAHVGAWLVGTGRQVPDDLQVDIPDLEAALLTLLDSDHTTQLGAAS